MKVLRVKSSNAQIKFLYAQNEAELESLLVKLFVRANGKLRYYEETITKQNMPENAKFLFEDKLQGIVDYFQKNKDYKLDQIDKQKISITFKLNVEILGRSKQFPMTIILPQKIINEVEVLQDDIKELKEQFKILVLDQQQKIKKLQKSNYSLNKKNIALQKQLAQERSANKEKQKWYQEMKDNCQVKTRYQGRKMAQKEFNDSRNQSGMVRRAKIQQRKYDKKEGVSLVENPEYKSIQINGNKLTLYRPENQCIFLEDNLPESGVYQFQIKIINSRKNNIMVGIGRKDKKNDFKQENPIFPLYYGRGLIWGRSRQQGTGFKQGDIVITELSLDQKVIKWSVNGLYQTQQSLHDFKPGQIRLFAPCITFQDGGDTIQWIRSQIGISQ